MREKTNKMQQMFIFNNISTCFGHHHAHLQENKTYYCRWCAALVLLDVVGSGCGALPCRVTFTVLTPHKAAPHNRYQPHPAEPAQHTTCSNTSCSPEDGNNDA